MIILTLLALITAVTSTQAQKIENSYIPCPMEWTSHSYGDAIPSNAVVATDSNQQDETNYIARIIEDGIYSGGRMEKGVAYTVENKYQIKDSDAYEILINPHGCEWSWVNDGNGDLVVTFSNGENVGRAAVRSNGISYMVPGTINGNKIYIVSKDNRITSPSPFQFLKSYSKGLKLRMTQFRFNQDLFEGNKDFLGIDEIHNQADTIVRQTVTHRKRTFESLTLASSSSSSHTFEVEAGFKPEFTNEDVGTIGGPDIGMKYTFDNTNTNRKVVHTEKEVEVSVTRAVEVPPFTSVTICSTVNIAEDFALSYEAKGKYTGAGLDSDAIALILAKDGITGEKQGNAVTVNMEGTLKGGLALTTQFIVIPNDDPNGCSQLASKIRKLKMDKKTGKLTKVELQSRNLEIDAIVERKFNILKTE